MPYEILWWILGSVGSLIFGAVARYMWKRFVKMVEAAERIAYYLDHESKPNGGDSTKDLLKAISKAVCSTNATVTPLKDALSEVHSTNAHILEKMEEGLEDIRATNKAILDSQIEAMKRAEVVASRLEETYGK